MLYLVATPIGNLADITFRAIETLKSSDLILCEDTRHSRILLSHYDVQKPLASYHKFNEKKELDDIIEKLQAGKVISLISDAGTPLIADPGFALVKACYEHNIKVESLPGPCAFLQALILSGISFERFQFLGFLPKKESDLNLVIGEMSQYPGLSICYESPFRLESTLQQIKQIDASLQIVIARELTKKFETILRGTVSEIINFLKNNPPKGECVLIVEGRKKEIDFTKISVEEHVAEIEKTFHVSKKEAIKIVAEIRDLNKRELYRSLHFKP